MATTVSCGEPAALVEVEREQRHQLVAVHGRAGVVDREAAVGVAVEGEAGVGAVREHRLAQPRQVGGSAALVDVDAVGLVVDREHRDAGVPQGTWPDLDRRAVRAVEHDAQPGRAVVEGAEQVVGVLLDGRAVRRDPADVGTGRALPLLVEALLDLLLERVVELHAAASQELDAVVGHRVVGGGDHHAEVGAERVGEEGDARGREHPEPQHVDARRGEPRDHRVLEELPRDPGVAADDGHRALPGVAAVVDEHARCRHPEVDRELGGDDTVGEPADPVRPEDARHRGQRISAC